MVDDTDYAGMLEEVRAEVFDRTRSSFSHRDARELGAAAARAAEEASLPAIVSVLRDGQLVSQAAFDGTTAEHEDWVRRKVNTALRHQIPSLELLLRQRVSCREPDWLDPREFAIAGGAVPILVAGNIAGVIAVSGLVGSVRADHDLAMDALRATKAVSS